jgi:hypothetical protein
MYWQTPASGSHAAVPVTITDNSGSHSTTINQQANGDKWMEIDQFSFTAHGACSIMLSTAGLPSGTVVSANAARLVPIDVLAVYGLSATDGPASGGTSVTLTGTGFDTGATVSFGGTPATAVTVVSPTSITCTTPAYASGRTDVVVNSGGAAYTRFGAFTFTGTAGNYSSWISGYGLSQNSPNDDPDGDRISNLLEYALGGHPAQSSSDLLPVLTTSVQGGNSYPTLTVQKNPAATGLTYEVEVSSDLRSWSRGPASITVLSESATSLVVRDNTPSNAAEPQRFLRLKVSQP